MSSARNKLVAAKDHVKTLRVGLIFFIVVVIVQWTRIGYLQEIRRIYIPPDLTQGLMTTFDAVPNSVVYTFVYYIFQQLQRWKEDGEKNHPEQIYRLQGFLTPACISALEEDMSIKSKLGELRGRVRTAQEVLGHGYKRERVLIETPESWLVSLDLNVQEFISGHPVKNVDVRYQLRVVKFDVDKETNPWGLAIACDSDTKPILIENNREDNK